MIVVGEILNVTSTPATPTTAREVESAVRRLDGQTYDLLLIRLWTGKQHMVGGGPSHFVCELSESDAERWALLAEANPDERINLSVGASVVDYPADWCVDLETVFEAVDTFLAEGRRNPKLQWSQET